MRITASTGAIVRATSVIPGVVGAVGRLGDEPRVCSG
jgi:hypothetical protein